MLRDEVAKYTELTGEDGNYAPIMKIGAYLDGYEKGLSVLDEVKAEIAYLDDNCDCDGYYKAVTDALQVIDKYRQEG